MMKKKEKGRWRRRSKIATIARKIRTEEKRKTRTRRKKTN